MEKKNIDYYQNKIEEIRSLPTIPAVVFRVMKLIGDENASFGKLEKVIADDPPMVAKIMKVANSGFYRTTNEIKSLNHI
ncbi:MAG: HDOD domain-containing protein [Calditrichia bacterium]|nr:HDOD domain-containing protein [Calditrichia bacterium]